MRLIDLVVSADAAVEVGLENKRFILPGAGSFADAVNNCPLRYVLGDNVRDATQTLCTQWPDLLLPIDRNLRVPAESLWLEWQHDESGMGAKKFGLLLDADPSGRSGHFRSFWEGDHGIEASQVIVQFDLDNKASTTDPGDYPLTSLITPVSELDEHLTIKTDAEWQEYFRKNAVPLKDVVRQCSQYVWKDAYRLLAFSRILSSRIELVQHPVDRSRINRARLKSKKRPLLDHIELSMDIGRYREAVRSGSGTRSAARMHVVRGHLVRRGDKIFWRSTHLRGEGGEATPMKRTILAR